MPVPRMVLTAQGCHPSSRTAAPTISRIKLELLACIKIERPSSLNCVGHPRGSLRFRDALLNWDHCYHSLGTSLDVRLMQRSVVILPHQL